MGHARPGRAVRSAVRTAGGCHLNQGAVPIARFHARRAAGWSTGSGQASPARLLVPPERTRRACKRGSGTGGSAADSRRPSRYSRCCGNPKGSGCYGRFRQDRRPAAARAAWMMHPASPRLRRPPAARTIDCFSCDEGAASRSRESRPGWNCRLRVQSLRPDVSGRTRSGPAGSYSGSGK